jgi:succinate dehydrogenase / fumarate reductase membrane anchor subunit
MKESSKWTLHVGAGVLILVLLGLHMLTMHMQTALEWVGLGTERVTSFESVAERGKQVSYMVIYILLLGAALYHGLYGLRNIALEVLPGRGAEKAVGGLLTVVGLAFFVLGTYAAITAFTMEV